MCREPACSSRREIKISEEPIFNPDPFPMHAGSRDICLGRVVDILEASGAFDPGSNPGRGVVFHKFSKMIVPLPRHLGKSKK